MKEEHGPIAKCSKCHSFLNVESTLGFGKVWIINPDHECFPIINEEAPQQNSESPAIPQQPHGEIADLDSWRRRYGAFLSQNSDCLTELCEIYEAIRKYLMQHSPVR